MENDIVAGQVMEDVLILGQNVENPTEVLPVVQAFGLSLHSYFLTSIFNQYGHHSLPRWAE